MLPNTLGLSTKQIEQADKFIAFVKQTILKGKSFRTDSCGTSPFYLKLRGSGLGDNISMHWDGGYKCLLTTDDGGDDLLCPDKFIKEDENFL